MTPDTEFDPFESELELGHTRSSCRLGMPPESSVGIIQALQQIYVLVAHKIMSLKVKFTSPFEFCNEKIDVTTFIILALSLKAKSDDIILSSFINRQ